MKFSLRTIMMPVVTCLIIITSANTGKGDEIYREFTGKNKIALKTLSGSCEIRRSESDKVTIRVIDNTRPRNAFEASIKDRGNSLRLTETIHESSSGNSKWLLTVPDGMDISFRSTSGSIEISDISGKFMSNSTSGSSGIKNCKGEFNFNSASGSYDIYECEGQFDIHSASGDVDIRGVTITDRSDFGSASGDINGRGIIVKANSNFGSASGDANITIGQSPEADLNVGSASGDAFLDYNGVEMVGYFEISARKYGGSIRTDVEFEKEEEFTKSDQKYIKKTARFKDITPFISIGTSTGRAELRR